jgi:UPF0755 protein
MSFPEIASMLSDKGVIEKPTWFRLYAMWNGDTTRVKTGKYLIKDNLAPKAVLAVLVAGVKEVTVRVTPRGKYSSNSSGSSSSTRSRELEALARDKEFLAKYAIAADSVEGYLFPDTYQFRSEGLVVIRRDPRHRGCGTRSCRRTRATRRS